MNKKLSNNNIGIKGAGIFLAQFISKEAPLNTLEGLCEWVANLGYRAIQVPTWEPKIFDVELAAKSQDYCDEILGVVGQYDLVISELSTHLQGQLIAVHPAYDDMFDGFAPESVRKKPEARTQWAKQQLLAAAKASQRLGLTTHASFSGSFLWHTVYPWPQRPQGLVEAGFAELAKRWMPILHAFDEAGVDVCYELHPGEDLHDGITFERFLEATGQHPRVNILYDPSHFVLQHLDYIQFIDFYHQYIKAFHVKDAELIKSGRSGVYGGYQSWVDRPGRFRSLGDGQVDFSSIFSKLAQYDYQGWAVLEWECCLKNAQDGAAQGVGFINQHIIRPSLVAFDDFAGMEYDKQRLNSILGLPQGEV